MNRLMFPMLIRGLIVTKSKNRWFRFGVRTLRVLTGKRHPEAQARIADLHC